MILLNIDQKNFILSVIILTLVLILLVLVMSESYSMFAKKIINGGFERDFKKDYKIRQVKAKDFRDTTYRISNSRNVTIDATKISNTKAGTSEVILDEAFLLEKKKKRLQKRTARKVWSVIFYVIIVVFLGLAVYQHFALTLTDFGGVSYATVITGSMSKSEEHSKYLEEIDDLQQFNAYSLVKLYKLDNEQKTNLNKYSIYAYKSKDNKLVIHRLVNISELNGETVYTFKGDANQLEDMYLVKPEQVLYEYKGESNQALGLIVGFSKSTMGFVSLVYVFIGLLILDSYESKKDKLYFDFLTKYIKEFNKEQFRKLPKSRIVNI